MYHNLQLMLLQTLEREFKYIFLLYHNCIKYVCDAKTLPMNDLQFLNRKYFRLKIKLYSGI